MVNNDCKNITFPMICQGKNSKEILTLAMNYEPTLNLKPNKIRTSVMLIFFNICIEKNRTFAPLFSY